MIPKARKVLKADLSMSSLFSFEGSGVLPAAKLRKNVPFLPILLDRASDQWRTFIVSADDGEGTPVPIPNTAVKLTRADNTWLEAARNDR